MTDIAFGRGTRYDAGRLTVDRDAVLAAVRQDPRIATAELEIARPGDAHAVGFQSALLARGADVTVTTIDGVSHVGLIQPRDVAGAEALAAVSDALGLPARGRRH